MHYAKMSITIPQEIYDTIKRIAARQDAKVSHVVADALKDKIKKIQEDELIEQINVVYSDSEVVEEQRSLAESIAESTDLQELPW